MTNEFLRSFGFLPDDVGLENLFNAGSFKEVGKDKIVNKIVNLLRSGTIVRAKLDTDVYGVFGLTSRLIPDVRVGISISKDFGYVNLDFLFENEAIKRCFPEFVPEAMKIRPAKNKNHKRR